MKGFTEQHLKDYLARHLDDPRIADALACAAPAAPQKEGRKGQEAGEGAGIQRSPGTLLLHASLPLEAVSVNELYANVPGAGRVLTKKGKQFKKDLAQALLTAYLPHPIAPQPLRLTLLFEGNWEKDGKPRKRDVSNATKGAEDALARFMGVDDCWFYEVNATKRHAAEPCLTVHVHALEYREGQS